MANRGTRKKRSQSEDHTASSEHHFIVLFRDAAWQYTYRGSITGPFSEQGAAVQGAIEAAQNSGEKDAEVIVQKPDMRQETVWRPAST